MKRISGKSLLSYKKIQEKDVAKCLRSNLWAKKRLKRVNKSINMEDRRVKTTSPLVTQLEKAYF
jgi:hypothetical protein